MGHGRAFAHAGPSAADAEPESIRAWRPACRRRAPAAAGGPDRCARLAAGLPAGRCTNWRRRRRSISPPRPALPSRSPRWRAARAAKRSGSRPISPRSRPAPPMARASTGSACGGAAAGAAGAARGRCALGDGRGAALPRARQRHRRTRRRRRRGRSHRDAAARARRARGGGPAFGLLLRHRPTAAPSAAATRWQVAAAPSRPDAFGGLGRRASTSPFARTAAARAAAGPSPGIIMSAPSMRRYLSVWLRRLSTDRIERRSSAPADEPRVVVASIKSALRLVALNDAAARLGLKPGMALADARAMYPALPVADADPEADRAPARSDRRLVRPLHAAGRARSAGRACCSTSPAARICSAARRRCARDLVRRLARQGLQARVAVADTVGCAWARGALRRVGAIVPRGENATALAMLPLPLAALRIDAEIVGRLAPWGLKRIADRARRVRARRLPRASARRLLRRLDQALGREDEPITPRLPVPSAMAEQRFPEPIALEGDVLGTIEHLARELGRVLERRGEGARLLQVALFRADGKVHRLEVGTGAPLRDPARDRAACSPTASPCSATTAIPASASTWCGSRRWSPSAAIRCRPGSPAPTMRRGAGASDRPARRALRPAPRRAARAAGHAYSGIRRGRRCAAHAAAIREAGTGPIATLARQDPQRKIDAVAQTRSRPRARSACSRGRSRSTPSPKCRTARRCASAGGACCTRSRVPKGRSASPWNGGATTTGRALTRDYFRVESTRRRARLALPRRPLRPRDRRSRAGICTGCSRERRRSAGRRRHVRGYAELAVTTNFSFLRGASHPEELVAQAEALGLAGIGIADRNSVAGVVRAHVEGANDIAEEEMATAIQARGRRAARLRRRHARHPRLSAATAPPGAGSRGCSRSASAAPRRANASSACRICSNSSKASISSSMPPAAASMPSRLHALARAAESRRHRATSVWLAASMLYRGDDARRLARLADIAERAHAFR